jgi:hypothetical protein
VTRNDDDDNNNNDSVESSSASGANYRSDDEEIARLLWNREAHYQLPKTAAGSSHTDPVYIPSILYMFRTTLMSVIAPLLHTFTKFCTLLLKP